VGNSKSSLILAKSWWSLVIRGLAGVSLGVATVVWRGIPLYDLIMLFFTWALFDGLVSIAGAVHVHALVVVVDGYSQLLLSTVLTDDVFVKEGLYFMRLRQVVRSG